MKIKSLGTRSLISGMTCLIALATHASSAQTAAPSKQRPNVIMFVMDDLNDWVGPLGHEQVKTPNMDRLAAAGLTFTNAHAPGVFCAPSRTAIWSGLQASTTGVYGNEVFSHDYPDTATLQTAFKRAGYSTYGAGKLYHHRSGYVDLRDWDQYFSRSQEMREMGWEMNSYHMTDVPLPTPHPFSPYYRESNRPWKSAGHLEWGPIANEQEEDMADTLRTNWARGILKQEQDSPFFLALGLYTPHHPHYAPQKYFDLYNVEDIELPPYKADDLDDLPPAIKKQYTNRAKQHQELEELGALKDAIHGYYAAISYADAMLGRILDELENSPHKDNTIVVLWSDQGFHLGEKGNWGKHTLWKRTTHVPFIWAGKGISQNQKVDTAVSLLDMYPTFVDLCGLTQEHELDGTALTSVLKDPTSAQDRDIFIPHMKRNGYAVVNSNWRYIRYPNGTEELYNAQEDPNEWDNLASSVELKPLIEAMRKAAPQTFAPPATAKDKLNLVVEGDTFRWEEK